jgi:hypothetical protein
MGNFNRLKSLTFLLQFGRHPLRQTPVFIRRHTSENSSKPADYPIQTVRIRIQEKPPTEQRMGEWMGDRAAGTLPTIALACDPHTCIEALLVGLLLLGLGLALSL